MHDDVVEKMGTDIDWECSKLLFFNNRACAGNVVWSGDENIDLCFVKFPIATLLNDGEKGMDVIFIHELIHAFETNADFIGIRVFDEATLI